MPATAAPVRSTAGADRELLLRRAASATAALMAVVYGLIFAGVLSVGRAEAGDLGVLGVAGAIFLALAVSLWFVRSRALWGAVALLQVMMAFVYIGVAPERDPSYEVWGISLRLLSLVLLITLVDLLVGALWSRRRSD